MSGLVRVARVEASKEADSASVTLHIKFSGGRAELKIPLGGYQTSGAEKAARHRARFEEIVKLLSDEEGAPPMPGR